MRAIRLSYVFALLAAGILGFASGASAQSLAEIAAKQKEKRKGKAVKIFTEEDLRKGSARGSPPGDEGVAAEGEPAAVPATTAAAPGGNASPPKTEEELRAEQERAWRERLQKSRDNVIQLEAEVNRLQTALNDLAQPAFGATRANRLAALEKAKQQLAASQQSIIDLEEEGRRNGYR